MFAPSPAKILAVANPIPVGLPAPVIRQVFPSKFMETIIHDKSSR